jgi:hypothetical protein
MATLLAGAVQAHVREIVVSATAITTGTNVQLGRPAANGTGGMSAGSLVQQTDADDAAGLTSLVSAFVTAQPTAPTVAMRIERLSAQGSAFGWQWEPGELVIPAAGQLILWLLAGQGSFDIFAQVGE